MAFSADPSYRLLAAQYVRKQAKQLAGQLQGVRGAEDIEFIHRARVASRRLRAAVQMFGDCFRPKQLKRWRKQIRRVTADLGEARDKDVQIEFLCGTLDALEEKACYPGIARLLVQLERQRERLQKHVNQAAGRFEASGVLEDMSDTTKGMLADAKADGVDVQSPYALARTRRHIRCRLEQLLSLRDCLADAEAKERHHAMRIAAKRLRYTLEIANPVYREGLKDFVATAKSLQTHLGEIHDCDVWLEDIESFAAKERRRVVKHFGSPEPFSRLQAGIEHLQHERRQRRRDVFRELAEFWQELEQQAHWETLVATLQAGGEPPDEPRPKCVGRNQRSAVPAVGVESV